MVSTALREAARLSRKALATARSGGIAGLARATGRHLSWHLGLDGYFRWRDGRIDRRFGIDTRGNITNLDTLGIKGAARKEATFYEAVQEDVFLDIMAVAGVDPGQYVFIDFGSGKGRALVLAAEAGFRKVVGVEISPALHEVAIRNVATYRRQRPQAGPIELRCGNAVAFELPPGDTLLFFYNPFREATLRTVISNAERAWRQQPRKLIVVYCNPVHVGFFTEFDFLEPAFRDHAFAVFHSR
jgi:SAM-dependent methyltransferase